MSTDVEEQLAHYFDWLDQQTGVTLHKPVADRVTAEDEPSAWDPELDALLVDLDVAPRPRGRRALLIIAVAALAIAVAGLGLLRTRHNAPATGPSSETVASWFAIDPTSAYADLGDGTIDDSATDPLACRRYDAIASRCDELVGVRVVNYPVDGGTVNVHTEHGPDESNLWQILQLQSAAVDIDGHQGVISGGATAATTPTTAITTASTTSGGWTVGLAISQNTRVIVQGAPSQTREAVIAIAESLTLVEQDVVLPIVFGDSVPTLGEMPKESVAARYYAGYVDLTHATPCVGAFGMPWNNEPVCTPVPDDLITATVASPSPAGTILIAALPARSASAAVVLNDGSHVPLVVTSVPGFNPRLVFADLDGAIPTQLIAYDGSGTSIAQAAVVSTGGAPLGYLPSAVHFTIDDPRWKVVQAEQTKSGSLVMLIETSRKDDASGCCGIFIETGVPNDSVGNTALFVNSSEESVLGQPATMRSDATDTVHWVSWKTSGVAATIRLEGISSAEARAVLTSVRVLSEGEWQALAESVATSMTTVEVPGG